MNSVLLKIYLGLILMSFAHVSEALYVNDIVEFYSLPMGKKVQGRVCGIKNNLFNNEKIFLVKLNNGQKIIEAPRGQITIIESSWLKEMDAEYTGELADHKQAVPLSLQPQKYNYFDLTHGNLLEQIKEKIAKEESFWHNIERICCLAEGGSDWVGQNFHLPLSKAFHKVFPEKEILVTDLDCQDKTKANGKLRQLKINNAQKFDEKILDKWGKADAVIMLRGLCHCGIINDNTSFSCGGMNTRNKCEIEKFLRQIVNIVNWENYSSFIYLDGKHFSCKICNSLDEEHNIESRQRYKKRMKRQNEALRKYKAIADKLCLERGLIYELIFDGKEFQGLWIGQEN